MLDKRTISLYGLILGIAFFSLFLTTTPPEGLERIAWITAGIAVLMTIWWLTEAIPIYATGLVPIVAFPLLNLYDLKEVASSYAHPLVLLFLGGFIIASAMQSSGLHKRIALKILAIAGTSPSKIIGGFMIATASLSMWVSNTASTVMMLPIAMSVITIFSRKYHLEAKEFAIPLLLGLAYSASIGGAATLIGTPTNIMLASILSDTYNYQISFTDWLIIGLPVVFILLPMVWFYLTKITFKVSSIKSNMLEKTLSDLREQMGETTRSEKVVAIIFLFTASLWIFRKFLNDTFDLSLNDTSIGLLGAILLFIIPTENSKRACNWDTANKIPWGVLFLVGGGIALSRAFQMSGLAEWVGSFANIFYDLNIYLLIFIAVAIIIFLTELNSNTATVATFTPILIIFAIGLNINPLFIVIPTTIAASCAFMLPIATPPNAVIFGSGKVRIIDMVKAGIFLNLLSIIIVSIICMIIMNLFFNFDINEVPSWIIK